MANGIGFYNTRLLWRSGNKNGGLFQEVAQNALRRFKSLFCSQRKIVKGTVFVIFI